MTYKAFRKMRPRIRLSHIIHPHKALPINHRIPVIMRRYWDNRMLGSQFKRSLERQRYWSYSNHEGYANPRRFCPDFQVSGRNLERRLLIEDCCIRCRYWCELELLDKIWALLKTCFERQHATHTTPPKPSSRNTNMHFPLVVLASFFSTPS